jgi:hypothetical protein
VIRVPVHFSVGSVTGLGNRVPVHFAVGSVTDLGVSSLFLEHPEPGFLILLKLSLRFSFRLDCFLLPPKRFRVQGSRVQGFKGSRVQGFKGSRPAVLTNKAFSGQNFEEWGSGKTLWKTSSILGRVDNAAQNWMLLLRNCGCATGRGSRVWQVWKDVRQVEISWFRVLGSRF